MLPAPRSRLVSLLVVLPLCSCGDAGGGGSAGPSGSGNALPMRLDTEFAAPYYVEDLACQSTPGAPTLAATTVNTWRNGAPASVAYGFAGATSTVSLAAPGIGGTYYGFYQKSGCATAGDPASCGDPTVAAEVEPLRICKPGSLYNRISVEGVALSSLMTLISAYNFYETIPSHQASLAASELLVLPSIENDYNDGTHTVETDNLAYTPSFGDSPAFVVFPKSLAAVNAGLWKTVNLWELPWGLAHEFGHHVFRTHTGVASVTSGFTAAVPLTSTISLPRNVGSTDYWGAVNEGYADLYSYYTWGAKPGLVQNVDCFAVNRDVAAANFATGQPKILTAEVLATFESQTTAAQSTSCAAPYFQDIHAIGAIVAHGVDEIFLATVGSAAPVTARANLQLVWAQNLAVTVATVGQSNLTLDMLIEAALRAAAPSGKLNADACAAAKTTFPEFLAKWRADGIVCS